MFLLSHIDMGFAEACLTALTGYGMVFLGLISLMIVLLIVGKIMVASQKRKASKAPAPAPAPAAPAAKVALAPGSAGNIKLYNVSDKDAAMIMSIVAYKLQKPLNELRFISIKEVE